MFPSFLNVDNPPSSFCPSPLPFSLYSFSFIIIYVPITPKSLSPGQICGAQMIITAYYCPVHNYLKSACPTLNCGSLLPSSLVSVSFPMFLFWVTQDQILEVIIDESNDSQPGVSFTPAQRDIWQYLKAFLVLIAWRKGNHVLLASCGQRSGMLLNILQGTGCPHIKNNPASSAMSVVTRLRNPALVPHPDPPVFNCPVLSPKYL